MISRTSKALCIVGSSLLLSMAILHGSGFIYVNDLILQSNVEGFLKEIFPILFIHPSFHLLSLAALGVLPLFSKGEIQKLIIVVAALIVIDASMAFYLGALLPGVLLLFAAVCFATAYFTIKKGKND